MTWKCSASGNRLQLRRFSEVNAGFLKLMEVGEGKKSVRNLSRLVWGRGMVVCRFSACLFPIFAKAAMLKITVKLILHKMILHFMPIFNRNLMILTLECSVLSVVRALCACITGQGAHRKQLLLNVESTYAYYLIESTLHCH